ncbi:MAG: SGNH/GDSL hydrolase family protein [Akkermansiaceae bacterium]|jgi:hypothetical protein
MKVLICLFGILFGAFATGAELPRVLVLGDSVYREVVSGGKALVQGRVQIEFPTLPEGEVFHSENLLRNLDQLLGEGNWDLIHFNVGLGDLIHRAPGMKSFRVMPRYAGGVRATSPDDYEKNLRAIVTRLKKTGAKLIWGTTTPIRSNPSDLFEMGSEVKYNEIAARIMAEEKVKVNDMYSFVVGLIDMSKPAPHAADPFSFDRKPIFPPVVRSILRELNLLTPIKGPLKVFLMVGGTNVFGGGTVADSRKPRAGAPAGSLDHLVLNPKTAKQFGHLIKEDGSWATRSDVWVQFNQRAPKSGALGIGYGGPGYARGIGPELGLGHVLGDQFDEQVLILKIDLGNPSVSTDLNSKGRSYGSLIKQIQDSTGALANKFPDYLEGSKFEFAGVVLDLGEKDKDAAALEKQLPVFIMDLRKELGVSDLPLVILGTGKGGVSETQFPKILEAQRRVAALPDLRKSVRFVDTRPFWPPEDERNSYRKPTFEGWYQHAGSFYGIGDAAGKALLEMIN